jgi:hypothetical protein
LATEPEYYQGAMFLLCAVARIRVLHFAGFVMVPQFAKTVTSNLPLLSVLGVVIYYMSGYSLILIIYGHGEDKIGKNSEFSNDEESTIR